MILKRTDSDAADFRDLVTELDEYLAGVDGEEHAYFAQFNGLDKIANVVIAYEGDNAVGCGAFKPYSDDAVEIKRMFVRPECRGRQIGRVVLAELESWGHELGYKACILETGHRQQAAVRLYRNCGYEIIPNYDQYAGVESSVCMKKRIGNQATVAI
jgi:putative acetyltransferase